MIEYGNSRWDLTSISFLTETVGIEDFRFIFPYVWDNLTYKITLKGNDLGGQNIFNHFRAVLGKIAKPGDNMVVVFYKSRRLSCYNSIEHIKEVLGEFKTRESRRNGHTSRFWYVGNKIDLEEHINNQKWCEERSYINYNKDYVKLDDQRIRDELRGLGYRIFVFRTPDDVNSSYPPF